MRKLDHKSKQRIFVGYSVDTNGYKLYELDKKYMIINRDVQFIEDEVWDWYPKDTTQPSVLVLRGSMS